MSRTLLIKNAQIVNESRIFTGSVLIEDGLITTITETKGSELTADEIIDATGLTLIPGVIDTQVHFRDPGLTHKGDLYTESRAAVAGGITSFFEMPNTVPNALSQELLEDKYQIAAEKSWANYSFYMGTSNDNVDEVLKTNPKTTCGIKIFLGASTGNMLVDKPETLEKIFAEAKVPIAVHCEDEPTIRRNTAAYKEKYGEDIPLQYHPEIRSVEACYKSTEFAINLARKHNTRLHILHLSTAKEMGLLESGSHKKRITAEVCAHHLWFCDADYAERGNFIKWNPAIKSASDREGLWQALLDDRIDVIATDHAPHTLEEKSNTYLKCPGGGPLVQHSLLSMLEHYHNGRISLEKIVDKMCHSPARIFNIAKRGYIRPGYHADLTLVDLKPKPWKVAKENLLYKCGWSPFEGIEMRSLIQQCIINGKPVFNLDTDAFYAGADAFKFSDKKSSQRLNFDR
jgi:dihydroorotase